MRTDRPARRGDRRRSRDQQPPRLPFSGDLLYGRNAVAEALRGRRRATRLFIAEGVREDGRLRALIAAAEGKGALLERVPRPMLDDATNHANHQGVALEASPYVYADPDDLTANVGTLLALDHLQDPQNVGTLLRAAEASGVAGVLIPRDRAASITPAVVNASAGAVEHLRIVMVPNLARSLDGLKDAGWWVIGLDTGEDAVDLFSADLPTPAILVVGAEAGGIGPNVRRRSDLIVSLPMKGSVASLNAATAGSIALFELLRREREAAP